MKIELSGHYGYGRLVKTMAPMVAMMVVTSVYSLVDGYFISNFAGSTPFAAMNLVWPAISLVAAFGLMMGSGGSALVSKTLGEGDAEKAGRIFSMIVRLTFVIGTVLAGLFLVFMRPVVLLLGSEGEMTDYAVEYCSIVVISLPWFMLQMAFQSFFMAAERPQYGTAMSLVSGLLNIGLDALLVVGFGMGLKGAAIATCTALSAGGILPLLFFASRRNGTHLKFYPRVRYDWRSIRRSCTNGLSEFVGNIAFNLIGICYNLQLMKYIGENGVSAYGIILYVGFIFGAVFIGYNLGITQIVAYNFGAGNKAEMRSLLLKSLVLIAVTGLVLTLISELSAPLIAKVFVGYDRELYELSVRALRIALLNFLICGVSMFTSAWFTALGNGLVSAIAAFSRTLVFELGAVFILPLFFGLDGIWMAVDFAELFALILSLALIAAFARRYGYSRSSAIM